MIGHGHWLLARGDDAEDFARTIDACAHRHDQTVAGTPRPEQFEQIRREPDELAAMNRNGTYTSAIMQLRARYAGLAGQATEMTIDHHTGMTAALARLHAPIEQAPPIAGGHGDIRFGSCCSAPAGRLGHR